MLETVQKAVYEREELRNIRDIVIEMKCNKKNPKFNLCIETRIELKDGNQFLKMTDEDWNREFPKRFGSFEPNKSLEYVLMAMESRISMDGEHEKSRKDKMYEMFEEAFGVKAEKYICYDEKRLVWCPTASWFDSAMKERDFVYAIKDNHDALEKLTEYYKGGIPSVITKSITVSKDGKYEECREDRLIMKILKAIEHSIIPASESIGSICPAIRGASKTWLERNEVFFCDFDVVDVSFGTGNRYLDTTEEWRYVQYVYRYLKGDYVPSHIKADIEKARASLEKQKKFGK